MTVREKAHNAFTTMLGAAGSCPASDAPKVRMDMYIMAECPLCSQVFPQIRSMIKCEVTCGSGRYALDFHLNMVGVLQQTGWSSLHGPNEVTGDELYLCAAKLYPDNYKYLDMIQCMEQNTAAIPSNAPGCAQQAGMDYSQISSCASSRGYNDLVKSFTMANQAQVMQTPTITMSNPSTGRSANVPPGSTLDVTMSTMCDIAGGGGGAAQYSVPAQQPIAAPAAWPQYQQYQVPDVQNNQWGSLQQAPAPQPSVQLQSQPQYSSPVSSGGGGRSFKMPGDDIMKDFGSF